MMGSKASETELIVHDRVRGGATITSTHGAGVSLSTLLMAVRFAHLFGVLGALLVYRGSSPTIDLAFMSGVTLMVSAVLAHRELRARIVGKLVSAAHPGDASSTSEWAEREADRLMWSNA